jgi:pilus assembly protein Flp/PilA
MRGDDGASAVEYGLLVAGIAAIIAIVVFTLGGFIKSALYDHTCNSIKDGAQMSSASCG